MTRAFEVFEKEHNDKYEDLVEAGYTRKELENMGAKELLDTWLKYEGIVGYSRTIWRLVEDLMKGYK